MSVRIAEATKRGLEFSRGWLICARKYHRLPAARNGRLGLRDGVRKNIRIKHHNCAYYCRERDGVPEHKPENAPFRADLVGRGSCDANRLRVNHLAHHAARAVG